MAGTILTGSLILAGCFIVFVVMVFFVALCGTTHGAAAECKDLRLKNKNSRFQQGGWS